MNTKEQKHIYKAWVEMISNIREYREDEDYEMVISYFDTEKEAYDWLNSFYSPSRYADYDYSHCSLGNMGVSLVVEES